MLTLNYLLLLIFMLVLGHELMRYWFGIDCGDPENDTVYCIGVIPDE